MFVLSSSSFLCIECGQSVHYVCLLGISKSACGYFYIADEEKHIYIYIYIDR